MTNLHESVRVEEVIDGMHIEKGSKYIDCTAGNGGHMEAILEQLLACKVPDLTPDGNPTMIFTSFDELNKKFK